MTTREIQGHLEEIYGIEVSPTLISNVTDAVIEEVKLWQGRPLELLASSALPSERILRPKKGWRR
jgi:putative transposase